MKKNATAVKEMAIISTIDNKIICCCTSDTAAEKLEATRNEYSKDASYWLIESWKYEFDSKEAQEYAKRSETMLKISKTLKVVPLMCVISYTTEKAAPQIYDFCVEGTAHDTAVKAYNWYEESGEFCHRHATNYPDNANYWTEQAEKYTRQRDTVQVILYDDFMRIEREILLAGEPEETTAEQFEEMLDVLPPAAWCTIDGIEMFCMSEMYTGTYTTQYAHDRKTNKYYCKLVDLFDRTTWINNFVGA